MSCAADSPLLQGRPEWPEPLSNPLKLQIFNIILISSPAFSLTYKPDSHSYWRLLLRHITGGAATNMHLLCGEERIPNMFLG